MVTVWFSTLRHGFGLLYPPEGSHAAYFFHLLLLTFAGTRFTIDTRIHRFFASCVSSGHLQLSIPRFRLTRSARAFPILSFSLLSWWSSLPVRTALPHASTPPYVTVPFPLHLPLSRFSAASLHA